MSNSINPYIDFNGRCREAMTFYRSCFGGDLELRDAGEKEKILHAELTVDGTSFIMGSDMMEGSGYIKGNNIVLAVGCNSAAGISKLFNDLSKNGKVIKPLKEEFWGAVFGSVEDQYGIKWFLNYDKK
jgi:PhnB protein